MTSYIQKDLIYFLEKAGHRCNNVIYHFSDQENDPFFLSKFQKIINEGNYDLIMSTNFFPLVAKLSFEHNLKYLSWSYDSPVNHRYIIRYNYPTNYIFLFDKKEVDELRRQGIDCVYHLPLAANTERLDALAPTVDEHTLFDSEISFLGQLYNNKSKELLACLTREDQAKIEDLIQRQYVTFGENIIKGEITEEYAAYLIPQLKGSIFNPDTFCKESFIHLFLKEVSHRERINILKSLSKKHKVTFYSIDELPKELSNVRALGSANYYTQMPPIFKSSTINLNSCLRSIESGIPLRCLDIIGCGGLLMSSWQQELAEDFSDGYNCILYRSIEEAVEKADFYLSHKDKCKTMALAGYQKVKEEYNYPSRIKTMFHTANIDA